MGILLVFATFISIVFSQMMRPMILSFLVIGCGIMVIIFLGGLLPLFWFSYVILLVFLGGLLVIFVYVSSLCPNEPIMGLGRWIWLLMSVIGLAGAGWWSRIDVIFIGGENDIVWLIKIYREGVGNLIMLLVVYLLLVLLVVVDLSLIFEGSLRVRYGWEGSKSKCFSINF